jgi:predicted GIY-YIG superfamily endonuclease
VTLDLNRPHWVYRMFDVDDLLLYVGMTHKPARRMTDWRKHGKADAAHWFNAVHRVSWHWYRNKPQAMRAERQAIQTEDPIHNVMLRPRVAS